MRSFALALVCMLLANCTPLPETLPTVPEVVEQPATDEPETDHTDAATAETVPQPTTVSHGIGEEEEIGLADDPDTGILTASRSPNREKAELLAGEAELQLNLGNLSAAVSALLNLDSLLKHDHTFTAGDRLQSQKTLLEVLASLNSLQRSLLLENVTDPDLQGWLALLETLDDSGRSEADFQDWRTAYPLHPAVAALIESYTVQDAVNNWQQIALLLPLGSADGGVARAFYDGFAKAHSRDHSPRKPELMLYDIGADSLLASFYYQAAEADGADFIVGPLGKKAVGDLLISRDLETDTLLLADIPPEKASDNLYGLSLSPESEARQVADKAYATGYRNVTVLKSEGEWGERVGNAFITHWQDLGGQIVKQDSFPQDVSRHAVAIQKFLGIDKSIIRHRLLKAQTGLNLKFSPRRNEDMDFIFLAATATQARLIVPQLRFFQAHDVPVYATSYVYAGNPEPAVDADLDGLIFGEMRWILDGVRLYKQTRAEQAEAAEKSGEEGRSTAGNAITRPLEEEDGVPAPELFELSAGNDQTGEDDADAQQGDDQSAAAKAIASPLEDENGVPTPDLPELSAGNDETDEDDAEIAAITVAARIAPAADPVGRPPAQHPYRHTALDRFYALGVQSYQIIPRLRQLRENSWQRMHGEAMTISVGQNGNAVHHPAWAWFVSGLAEPLPLQLPE